MFFQKSKLLPIIILILLSGCNTAKNADTITNIPNKLSNESTFTPSMDIVSTTVEYTWPSSAIIYANDPRISIEVIMYVRDTCFRIDITAYNFQWPPSSTDDHIVNVINYFDGSTEIPITLEEVTRGGGGGGEGFDAQTEEMYMYDIKIIPIPTYITAIIIFDGIFGISQPVRFTLKPISRPSMGCPQLPATTPEG